MKTTKLLLGIALTVSCCCSSLFAQKATCYKGVCIMRGEHNPDCETKPDQYNVSSCDWTKNCVYVYNGNSYDVIIRFDYKLNDRDAPWKTYSYTKNHEDIRIAPSYDTRRKLYSHIPETHEKYSMLVCFPGEIKALRLSYVDILQPSAGEKIKEFLFGGNNDNNQKNR